MQLAEFGNVDKVSACFQLRLSALKMEINGAIAGGTFFPIHFSTFSHSCYTSFGVIP